MLWLLHCGQFIGNSSLAVSHVCAWTIKLDNSYIVKFIFSCAIVIIHISVEYHYWVIYYNMRHPLVQCEYHYS